MPMISLICRRASEEEISEEEAQVIWDDMQSDDVKGGNFNAAADLVGKKALWSTDVSIFCLYA